jgi:hypothetical protein
MPRSVQTRRFLAATSFSAHLRQHGAHDPGLPLTFWSIRTQSGPGPVTPGSKPYYLPTGRYSRMLSSPNLLVPVPVPAPPRRPGTRVAWRSVASYLRIGRRIQYVQSFDIKIITMMNSDWENPARRPRITRRWWAPPGMQDEENQL